MRRLGWILLLLLLAAAPLQAEKKLSVQELRDLFDDLQQQKKTDTEVAFELKQVVLTEQLTMAAMNALAQRAGGSQTVAQIYVLEARSAILPPPREEVPSLPAPDAAQQSAILKEAASYVASVYDALPVLLASQTTLRFQDNLEAIASSSGMQGGAKDASVGSLGPTPGNQYVRYIHSVESHLEIRKGVPKSISAVQETKWGQNGMIALESPNPALNKVFSDARAEGSLHFARWENINGKITAVFTYSIEKKKALLPINICCFPTVNQAGIARFYTATMSSVSGLNGGGVKGDMQSNTEWKNFKRSVAYHGAIFITPDTGVVMRLVTQADFKSSDYVRQQNERIDYAPIQLGSRSLVAPVQSIVQSEVMPQGDSGAGGHTLRHTYFISEYKNYSVQ